MRFLAWLPPQPTCLGFGILLSYAFHARRVRRETRSEVTFFYIGANFQNDFALTQICLVPNFWLWLCRKLERHAFLNLICVIRQNIISSQAFIILSSQKCSKYPALLITYSTSGAGSIGLRTPRSVVIREMTSRWRDSQSMGIFKPVSRAFPRQENLLPVSFSRVWGPHCISMNQRSLIWLLHWYSSAGQPTLHRWITPARFAVDHLRDHHQSGQLVVSRCFPRIVEPCRVIWLKDTANRYKTGCLACGNLSLIRGHL